MEVRQGMQSSTTRGRALLAEVARTGGRQPSERSILDRALYTRLGRAYEMADERKRPARPTRRYWPWAAVGARLEVLSLNRRFSTTTRATTGRSGHSWRRPDGGPRMLASKRRW